MTPSELYNKFLNLKTPNPGPAELLGLPSTQPASEAMVRAVLGQRLEQVDDHPQARTPEADQVRMALHAAAAILSDELLRAAVEPAASPPSPQVKRAPRAPAGAPPAPAAPMPIELSPLEQAIVAILAGSGGWSSRSQQQLATVALRWNLTPAQLLERVRLLAERWTMADGGAAGPAPALPAEAVPRVSSAPWGARIAVLLALLVGVSAVIVSLTTVYLQGQQSRRQPPVLPFPDRPSATTTSGDSRQGAGSGADARAGDRGDDAPATPALSTAAELVQEAKRLEREIVAAGGTLPSVTRERLRDWLQTVGRRWPTFSAGELTAINQAGLEAVQAAGDVSAAAQEVAGELGRAANLDASAAVFLERSYLAGLLAVIYVDERTSRVLREAVASAVGDWPILPGDRLGTPAAERAFARGALAALRLELPVLVQALAADEAAAGLWTQWRGGVGVGHRLLGTNPQGDHLAAAEVLLLAPERSVGGAGSAFDTVLRRLLSLIDFSSQANQGVVVQWLLDPRIGTRDLHTVTSCIVELELAPDLGDEYILAAEAPVHERTQLTRRWSQGALTERAGTTDDRTGQAVGSAFAVDSVYRRDWLLRVERELEQSIEGISLLNRLQRAVRYARLRQAAEQIGRGELDAARDRLAALRVELVVRPRPEEPEARNDGELTRTLAVEGLTDARKIDLMRAFAEREPHIGPIDARTLATLAFAESSLPIRDTAQGRIRWDYGDSPHMVQALLDLTAGTRVIRSPGLSETIERITGERLPDTQDDRFLGAMRLALAQHLLEVRASAYHGKAVDELADLLAEAYQAGAGATGNLQAPEVEAQRLYEQWRDLSAARSARLPGDEDVEAISRRLAAALRLAPGPMQRFVALQRALLEQMAAVVIAESPADEEAVLEILRVARLRLTQSQGVVAQVEFLERSMLQVMLLRFDAATPLEASAP